MSLTISSAVAREHANNVARTVGPHLFKPDTLDGFYRWFDNLVRSSQDKTQRLSNVNKLINSVPCDYSYRVVARHPFLLGGYEYKKNNNWAPEEVREVFDKLFSNFQGNDPYSKDDLENFLDSMVTLVGYDVLYGVPETGSSRNVVENSSRVLHR